ncbi:MAG: type II CAAX endopeptidase family protein [Nitrospirota bacterium]
MNSTLSTPWTIKDIFLVGLYFIITIFIIVTLTFLLTFRISGQKITYLVFMYLGDILMATLPIYWIKKKYGLNKEALGLTKNNHSPLKIISIGLIVAIIYFCLAYFLFFKPNNIAQHSQPTKINFTWLFLEPFSIDGFNAIILSPVAEEIMDRGFIYPYIRKKIGIIPGLAIQALIFSLLHINFHHKFNPYLFMDGILFQATAGILYEKTKSVYPSMVFHSCTNYLIMFSNVTL